MKENPSEAIRRARQQKGLTQRALAKLAGVSKPVISYAENNKPGFSAQTLARILQKLDLDPTDHIEGYVPTTQAHAHEPQPQGPRQHTPKSLPDPAEPTPFPQRNLSHEEQVNLLEKQLERLLQAWSRNAPVTKVSEGTWQIPPDAKKPETIAQELTRTETYTNEYYQLEDALIDLQPGLLIVQFDAHGEGSCNLTLAHTQRATNYVPNFSLTEQERETAWMCYIPVTQEDLENALPPGQYRLEADGDAQWDFTWTQPAPGTAHLDIIEHNDYRLSQWNGTRTLHGGPTTPTRVPLWTNVVQETPERLIICAYPVDASATEVKVLDKVIGPEPETIPCPLDPNKEYYLHISATARWDMFFTDQPPG